MGQAASKQEDFWEACCYGRLHLVKKHIQDGIDVNWVSYTHDSCAIHVASQGKPEVVEMLLAANCDVNVQDNRGNLAIHHAAMRGHSDILKTLIDAKSDINGQDKNGWTSLHCAAYWCQPRAVDVLIKKGCDVNIQNKDQRTALHEVARNQETDEPNLGDIARTLIDAGCDINAKSSDEGEADFTPLMFAAYHGHPEVAMALLDAGCEMNAYGTNLWTALHWAADRNHEEVVYILLEAGADPALRGLRGELPSDRAKNKELSDTLNNAYNMQCELAALEDVSNPMSFGSKIAAKSVMPIKSSIPTHLPEVNFNETVQVNKRTAIGRADIVVASTEEEHVSNIKALLAKCQLRQKEKALKAKEKSDSANFNASGNVEEAKIKDENSTRSNEINIDELESAESQQSESIDRLEEKQQCALSSSVDSADQKLETTPCAVSEELEDVSNDDDHTQDDKDSYSVSTSDSLDVSPELVQIESTDDKIVEDVEPAIESSTSDLSGGITSDIVPADSDSSRVNELSDEGQDNVCPESDLVCLESEMLTDDLQSESDSIESDVKNNAIPENPLKE